MGKTSKIVITLTLASFALLTFGILIDRYELLPIPRLVAAGRPIRNDIKMLVKNITMRVIGEDAFIQEASQVILDKHYRRDSAGVPPTVRPIDTTNLPLLFTTVRLQQEFAAAGVIGGALARVEDSLFLMDGLGNILDYQNGLMPKMDYGVFPKWA